MSTGAYCCIQTFQAWKHHLKSFYNGDLLVPAYTSHNKLEVSVVSFSFTRNVKYAHCTFCLSSIIMEDRKTFMGNYQSFDTIVSEPERCLTRYSRDIQPLLVRVYFVDQR